MTPPNILAVTAALLFAGCSKKDRDPPAFSLDQCARVSLVDAASGAEVVGAEDFDIDRETGRLFISAYDRRKVERAAKERAPSLPQGGVYAIDVAALLAGERTFTVQSLLDPEMLAGGLRPHGTSFDAGDGALSFVNRSYVREGRDWRLKPEIVTLNLAAPEDFKESEVECAANDLVSRGGRFLVTLDHSGCGWRATMEDVFGTRSGRVVDGEGATLLSGIGFANGMAMTPDGAIVVAATRERALFVASVAADGATITSTVKLAAAPDNLTLSDEGRIVAAVHPRLLAIGMQRKLGIGRSPSRAIEVDLESGDQTLLFDDPNGQLLSAVTAAIFTQGMLVMGSVSEAGLAVCRGGEIAS